MADWRSAPCIGAQYHVPANTHISAMLTASWRVTYADGRVWTDEDRVEVLHKEHKHFWKTRTQVDIIIVEHKNHGLIEIVTYEPALDMEAPRLYLNDEILFSKLNASQFEQSLSAKKEPFLRQHKVPDKVFLRRQIVNEAKVSYVMNRLSVEECSQETRTFRVGFEMRGEDSEGLLVEAPEELKRFVSPHIRSLVPGEVKECYENLAAEQQMILDLRRQATLNQGMSRMLCSSLTHGNLSSMYGKMLKKMHLPINHSRMRPTAHSAPRLSPMRPIRLAPVPKGTVPMSKAQSPKAPAIGKLQPTWSTSRIVTAGLSSFRRSFMGAKSPKVADVEVDILDKPATPHPRSNKPLIRKTSSFMRSLSAVTDLSLTHTSGEKYELKGERSPPAEALSKPQLKTEEKTGTEDVDMEDRALMQRRLRIQTTPSTTTPAPLLRSPKHSPKHGLHIEVSEEISAASLRRQQTINEEKSAARQERLDIEESRKSVQESRKTMPGSRKSLQEGGKSVLEEAERSDRIRTREVELRTEYPNCLSPVVQHNGEAL